MRITTLRAWLAIPVLLSMLLSGTTNAVEAKGREPKPRTYADKIGADVGGMNERGWEFIDVGKTLREWEVIGGGTKAPVDAQGWPTSDAQTVFFDVRPFGAWWGYDQANCPLCADGTFQADLSGTYKLSFSGQATIGSFEGAVSVQNQQYNTATNRTTADIVVAEGQGLLAVTFTATKRTADAATNTGIADLKLLRPGYSDDQQVFTPDFINALKPFDTLRFMNWTGGNNLNPPFTAADNTIDWAERNTVEARQPQKDGVAWEYVIEAANRSGKNIWINIPVHASDDYVRGLASLLKTKLHKDAVIYIEYSNEVWNWGFTQATYNQLAAQAEVLANPNSPLALQAPANGELNGQPYNDLWRVRRYSGRLIEIGNIFQATYGNNALNNKVRLINAWQIVQPWQFLDQMNWVQQAYGPPSTYFYALAGAGYFNNEGSQPDDTVDEILARLRESSDASVRARTALKNVANRFNVKLAMYEGGPDTAGPLQWNRPTVLLENSIAAHRDERTRDLIVHDMRDNWFEHPNVQGDMFMYFTVQSAFNRWGQWGLTEDLRDTDTAKFRAIYELTGRWPSAPQPVTNLTAVGGDESIELTWKPEPRATSYEIRRMSENRNTYRIVGTTTDTRFVDNNLRNSTSYSYVVVARNSAGRAPNSNSASATPSLQPPSAPVGLTADTGNGVVELRWNDTLGAQRYSVKRATSATGPFTEIAKVNRTFFRDRRATNETTLYYVVSAINRRGESANSAVVAATPTAFIFLSDIPWKSATSGFSVPVQDSSVALAPLTTGGKTYAKGIGTHAPSEIVYTLDGKYKRFQSLVGRQDGVGDGTHKTVFKVYLDGVERYASAELGEGQTESIDLDLTGVNELKLVVEGGSDGAGFDHANWLNARIAR